MYKCRDAPEHRNVLVFPDSDIGGRDAALGKYRGRLDHYQACAALGPAPQVHQVPVIGKSVVR